MSWIVPREWGGETCFILGGGPSLRNFDPEILRGKGRIIVINRSFRMCPWADVLYFCDNAWFRTDRDEILRTFTGKRIVSISRNAPKPVLVLQNTGHQGLEKNPTGLKHGTNSGYQAINLAYHFGVKRIVLLGYDQTVAADGQTHHHGGYGLEAPVLAHIMTSRMLPYFERIAKPLALAGVLVLNANPDSAITCWPRLSLAEILEKVQM